MMKKIIATIVILVVLAGAGFFLVQKLTPDEVVPLSVTMDIEGTINDIGELSTAEYAYRICKTMTKEGLKIPVANLVLTKSEIIYGYEGAIKAGIQFKDIKIDVQEAEDITKIYVHLPAVQIFSNELDNDSLVVYAESLSNFNKVSFKDLNLDQIKIKKEAEEDAIENGLLERAKENSKSIIRSTIEGFYGADNCEVEFY